MLVCGKNNKDLICVLENIYSKGRVWMWKLLPVCTIMGTRIFVNE